MIVSSAIPAALSHGVLKYPYAGYNYTACVFLRDLGYNHIAFQVILNRFYHLSIIIIQILNGRDNVIQSEFVETTYWSHFFEVQTTSNW